MVSPAGCQWNNVPPEGACTGPPDLSLSCQLDHSLLCTSRYRTRRPAKREQAISSSPSTKDSQVAGSGAETDPSGPLFRTTGRKTGQQQPMWQQDAYRMIGATPPMVKYCTLRAKEGLKASKCCQRKLYTAPSGWNMRKRTTFLVMPWPAGVVGYSNGGIFQ